MTWVKAFEQQVNAIIGVTLNYRLTQANDADARELAISKVSQPLSLYGKYAKLDRNGTRTGTRKRRVIVAAAGKRNLEVWLIWNMDKTKKVIYYLSPLQIYKYSIIKFFY